MKYEFSLFQNGIKVASGIGPDENSMISMAHQYMIQYLEDGPVTLSFKCDGKRYTPDFVKLARKRDREFKKIAKLKERLQNEQRKVNS